MPQNNFTSSQDQACWTNNIKTTKSIKCSIKMTGQVLPNCTILIHTAQQEPSFAQEKLLRVRSRGLQSRAESQPVSPEDVSRTFVIYAKAPQSDALKLCNTEQVCLHRGGGVSLVKLITV